MLESNNSLVIKVFYLLYILVEWNFNCFSLVAFRHKRLFIIIPFKPNLYLPILNTILSTFLVWQKTNMTGLKTHAEQLCNGEGCSSREFKPCPLQKTHLYFSIGWHEPGFVSLLLSSPKPPGLKCGWNWRSSVTYHYNHTIHSILTDHIVFFKTYSVLK